MHAYPIAVAAAHNGIEPTFPAGGKPCPGMGDQLEATPVAVEGDQRLANLAGVPKPKLAGGDHALSRV
jgi:hypothetical protein